MFWFRGVLNFVGCSLLDEIAIGITESFRQILHGNFPPQVPKIDLMRRSNLSKSIGREQLLMRSFPFMRKCFNEKSRLKPWYTFYSLISRHFIVLNAKSYFNIKQMVHFWGSTQRLRIVAVKKLTLLVEGLRRPCTLQCYLKFSAVLPHDYAYIPFIYLCGLIWVYLVLEYLFRICYRLTIEK